MAKIQHSGAKIESESVHFNGANSFMPHLKKPRAPAREKKKKFTAQWQYLMTFD